MNKIFSIIVAMLAVVLPLGAHGDTGRAVPAGSGAVQIITPDGHRVAVRAVAENIMEVVLVPAGADSLRRASGMIALPADASLATGALSSITAASASVGTSKISAEIHRATGGIIFRDGAGRVLLRQEAPEAGAGRHARFLRAENEKLFGGGERSHRYNLAGDSLVGYNRPNYGYGAGDARISQMNITVPWVASDAGYAIFFDDHGTNGIDLRGNHIDYRSSTPGATSYYVVAGDGSLAALTEGYAALTGLQPLPPLWSLGYITSRYGYHNEKETLGAIDSLKRDGYPVDGLVLDLYWYGDEQKMGRFDWDRTQFPDPEGMLAKLKKQGVNVVAITQPFVMKEGAAANYDYLSRGGMLGRDSLGRTHDVEIWVGTVGMLDVSNPDTRAWMWNQYKRLTEQGVEGWWGDLGEPEQHPATMRHANGEDAAAYHNMYGNDWAQIVADGFRRDFPDRRLMLLMRGGTGGLQRWGVLPWSGDVARSWQGLQAQIPTMFNSGLSGLGYMSSDLGGFAGDAINPELYLRWVQMGVFTPIFRTHAQLAPEPYRYPQLKKQLLDAVRERYRWLPFNYTLAYENASRGLPLVRPLNFRASNALAAADTCTTEYLWGDNVLVAPVLEPGLKTRSVIFPDGKWIDWYNPRLAYAGGTTARVRLTNDHIPVFVRAGSFIPQYVQPIANVEDYDPRFMTIYYFPSEKTTDYTMYDDNRVSPNSIADEAYRLLHFTGRAVDQRLTLSMSDIGGNGYDSMASVGQYTFEIPRVKSEPESVSFDGEELPRVAQLGDNPGWTYNARTGRLSVRVAWNYSSSELIVEGADIAE